VKGTVSVKGSKFAVSEGLSVDGVNDIDEGEYIELMSSAARFGSLYDAAD